MDDNEAFIEEELFEEVVGVDDNAGPSHHLDGNRVQADKQVYIKKNQSDDEEDDDDYEEEEINGHIIQGEDGEFYVVMDDDGVEAVEVDDDPTSVAVMVADDGEQQLVFQSIPVDPHSRIKRTRPARAILQDTEGGQVEMIQFTDVPDDEEGGTQLDLAVGAIQTAEATDEHILHHGMMEPMPKGLKLRRSRVYGTCRCNECGQSFVNTARLERHLAVHQVFGSFLCPLCGKTYKYEYNLFYHWRRTCRDLNELMSYDDRKTMDVNALRSLVDEVAAKKQEYGPIEIGISRSVLFQSGPLARLEMPSNPLGRRGTTCRACGVVVHLMHLSHHLNLHKGVMGAEPDQKSAVGGHYCDLCGLLFRQHFNLIKHWRTNCAEIQANLPENVDITLDDGQLKAMVCQLLKRASTNESILDAESQRLKGVDGRRQGGQDSVDVVGGYEDDEMESRRERDEADDTGREEDGDEEDGGGRGYDREIGNRGEYADDEPGAVFADDFEDDEVHMLGEEAIGAGGTVANRAKWNMAGGPVQCNECFRSFANPGRLERHMAGFHASHGSHHCALCGNRFKYDYNLLYHYRKSCPYTKNFIERDVRDQMDAANLRKLVRTLAQKDLRLQPVTHPVRRLVKPPTHQSNDAMIRREMMRPILANAPAVLTQARRGMSGMAKQCPICNIMFYQDSAIQRHMSMRHGMDYSVEEYAEEDDELQQFEEEQLPVQQQQQQLRHHPMAKKRAEQQKGPAAAVAAAAVGEEEALDDDDAPPQLEVQAPGEEAVLLHKELPQERTRFASLGEEEHDEVGVEPQHHVDMQEMHHVAPPHMRDVQEMYERGELRDGDRIIIQEGGREVEYTVNDETLEMAEEEDGRDEEAEEAAAYAEERQRHEQRMVMRGGSRQPQQHMQQQQRRFPAGGDRPSTSAAAAAASRKRPREEEPSMWDDDLLEDDEELEDLQREVNRRRADDAARGSASGRGRMPSIMQRRGM